MPIFLHHFFLLTARPDQLAAELTQLGLTEGSSNNHPGQGTANRRFFLPGSTFEILYIRDAEEARTGPAKGLRFNDRISGAPNNPFGLIFESEVEPFAGWKYYPEYFNNQWFFHIGENSEVLGEPLCIVMPKLPFKPDVPPSQQNVDWKMTKLVLSFPSSEMSSTLEKVSSCEGLILLPGQPLHMQIEFNRKQMKQSRNLMPEFPLTISW